jgi:hypothetical protein
MYFLLGSFHSKIEQEAKQVVPFPASGRCYIKFLGSVFDLFFQLAKDKRLSSYQAEDAEEETAILELTINLGILKSMLIRNLHRKRK